MDISLLLKNESESVINTIKGGKNYVIQQSKLEGITTKLFLERFRNHRTKKASISIISSKEDAISILNYFSGDVYKIGLLFSMNENRAKTHIGKLLLSDDEFKTLYLDKNLSYEQIVKTIGFPNIVTREHLKNRNKSLRLVKTVEQSMSGIHEYMNDKSRMSAAQVKRERTNTKKYGNPFPLQNDKVKQKLVSTNLKKYGVKNTALVPEFKEKRLETTRNRWGAENYTSSAYFREEQLYKTFNETPYVKTVKEAVMLLTNKENGEISDDLHQLLRSIDSNGKFTLKDISKIVGIPYSYLDGAPGAPGTINLQMNHDIIYTNRRGLENDIYEFVDSLGVNITSNKLYKELGGLQLDFYIPEYKLGIEFNGSYYHATDGSSRGVTKKYHQIKTKLARENMGISLFHIWEYDWNNTTRKEIIKSQLRYKFHKGIKSIYARKTELKEISSKCAREFFNKNHIQGGEGSEGTFRYGLFIGDELISAMTFGKRYTGNHDWELIRFANKLNTSVVGGASKLLKFFEKNHKGEIIMSYANNDFGLSEGSSMYSRLGFSYIKTTQPGYHWIKLKTGEVINRQKVMPKNLVLYVEGRRKPPFINASKDFRKENQNETEAEYMVRNGFVRVYNAGNDLYEKRV